MTLLVYISSLGPEIPYPISLDAAVVDSDAFRSLRIFFEVALWPLFLGRSGTKMSSPSGSNTRVSEMIGVSLSFLEGIYFKDDEISPKMLGLLSPPANLGCSIMLEYCLLL